MRTPALIYFGGLTALGMFWQSAHGENLFMVAVGLIGFTASLFIPKDSP